MSHPKFVICIDACNDCASACEHCSTACINDQDALNQADCITLNRYTADMCRTAAAFMSRSDKHSISFIKKFCDLCAEICIACATECEKNVHMEQCKSAEACRICASECNNVIQMEFQEN